MCMKGDTLSSPYFFLMGHSKDTVCTQNCMPLSILAVLCACMHVCVTLSLCMGRKQPCVCECFKYIKYGRALWFEPSGCNYHHHDKVCEVDCIKSICSLSLCHTITNVFFSMLNRSCPFYLLLCKLRMYKQKWEPVVNTHAAWMRNDYM